MFSRSGRSPRILLSIICCLFLLLSSCANDAISTTSQPSPTNPRTFLNNLSVEFLDEYHILDETFNGTKVGGLSAIDYDSNRNIFYALSDDRSNFNPARFYELSIDLDESGVIPQIDDISLQNAISLTDENGETFGNGTVDPEGLNLSPRNTLFISRFSRASRINFSISGPLSNQSLKLFAKFKNSS